MTLLKESYSIHRKPIALWLENKPDADLTKEISYIAIATGCHIVVVLEFIMEIVGRTEVLAALQKKLMLFYDVAQII